MSCRSQRRTARAARGERGAGALGERPSPPRARIRGTKKNIGRTSTSDARGRSAPPARHVAAPASPSSPYSARALTLPISARIIRSFFSNVLRTTPMRSSVTMAAAGRGAGARAVALLRAAEAKSRARGTEPAMTEPQTKLGTAGIHCFECAFSGGRICSY